MTCVCHLIISLEIQSENRWLQNRQYMTKDQVFTTIIIIITQEALSQVEHRATRNLEIDYHGQNNNKKVPITHNQASTPTKETHLKQIPLKRVIQNLKFLTNHQSKALKNSILRRRSIVISQLNLVSLVQKIVIWIKAQKAKNAEIWCITMRSADLREDLISTSLNILN